MLNKITYYPGLLYKSISYNLSKSGEVKGISNLEVDPSDPSFLMNLDNTLIYLNNNDKSISKCQVWDVFAKLHELGFIHLGMRRVYYYLIKQMDFFTLNTNKGKVRIILADSNDSYHQKLFLELEDVVETVEDLEDTDKIKYQPKLPDFEIIDLKDLTQAHLDKLGNGLLGFDFETANNKNENGFPLIGQEVSDFRPLGFSLVSDTYGIFIDFRRYTDYQDPVYELIHKFIKENANDRFVAYNCQFEMQCLMHMWDETYFIHDGLVMTNCDDYRTNLKVASQRYNHSPSWDDELDEEMGIWYQICHTPGVNKKESVARIVDARCEKSPEYTREEILDIYRENMKVMPLHNSWGLAFPPILGKYCIYDSFYTLKLYKKLVKKYPKCVDVYHNNMWFGTLLHSAPVHISLEGLSQMDERNKYLLKFSRINILYYYYRSLDILLKPYLKDFKVSKVMENILEYAPQTITLPAVKQLKEITKICISTNDTNFKLIKDIYGDDFYLKFVGMFNNDINYISSKMRARTVWETLAVSLEDTSEVIKKWNLMMVITISHRINTWNQENKKFLNLLGTDAQAVSAVTAMFLKRQEESAVKRDIDPREDGKFENAKYLLEAMLNEEGSPSDFSYYRTDEDNFYTDAWQKFISLGEEYYVRFQHNEFSSLFSDKYGIKQPIRFIKDELNTTEDIIGCIPSFILRDYYSEGGKILCNFKSLIDYYTLKRHLSEMEGIVKNYNENVSNKYDQLKTSDEVWWSNFYKDSYTQKFNIIYSIVLAHPRTIWFMSKCLEYEAKRRRGIINRPLNKVEFEAIMKKSQEIPLTVALKTTMSHFCYTSSYYNRWEDYLYPNIRVTSGFQQNCMAFYPYMTQYSELFGDKFILQDYQTEIFDYDKDGELEGYVRFCQYYYLEMIATKQRSPYITRFKEDSHKIIRDSTYDSIIDNTQHGDACSFTYEVNTKKTKRFSSFFHTLPPRGDETGIVSAKEGEILSYFDISQAEPRTVAFFSGDEQFISDYRSGQDVYMKLASLCYPDKPKEELKTLRSYFKSTLLGIHYGMSITTLANRIHSSVAEAQKCVDTYFNTYPKVKKFINDRISYARNTGYAMTVFGDKISVEEGREKRAGINYPIQNAASISMIAVFFNAIRHAWEDYKIPLRLVGNIHDSLECSFPIKYLFYIKEIFQKFSREKGYAQFGVDFGYDFEICRCLNAPRHFEYSINFETGEFETEGPQNDVHYLMKYLKESYDISDYEEEITDVKAKDQLKETFTFEYFNQIWDKDHTFCRGMPFFHIEDTLKVKCKVNYDFMNDPILKAIWSVKF